MRRSAAASDALFLASSCLLYLSAGPEEGGGAASASGAPESPEAMLLVAQTLLTSVRAATQNAAKVLSIAGALIEQTQGVLLFDQEPGVAGIVRDTLYLSAQLISRFVDELNQRCLSEVTCDAMLLGLSRLVTMPRSSGQAKSAAMPPIILPNRLFQPIGKPRLSRPQLLPDPANRGFLTYGLHPPSQLAVIFICLPSSSSATLSLPPSLFIGPVGPMPSLHPPVSPPRMFPTGHALPSLAQAPDSPSRASAWGYGIHIVADPLRLVHDPSFDKEPPKSVLKQTPPSFSPSPARPAGTRLKWTDEISILEFPVTQMGSVSVPHTGSYSVGLCWHPRRVMNVKLDAWEKHGVLVLLHDDVSGSPARVKKRTPNPKRLPEERLTPMTEKERKRLLKQCKAKLRGSEAYALAEIRQSRGKSFCLCTPPKKSGKKCCSKRCPCVQSGVNCQIENSRGCTCTAAACANPEGATAWNRDAIQAIRQNTLNALRSQSEPVLARPQSSSSAL